MQFPIKFLKIQAIVEEVTKAHAERNPKKAEGMAEERSKEIT